MSLRPRSIATTFAATLLVFSIQARSSGPQDAVERAVKGLGDHGRWVDENLLRHLSPLG